MPLKLTGSEKARAKQEIMALVTPWLLSAGLTRVAGGRTGGTFEIRAEDGARLVLSLGVPTFDSFFRLWSSWENESGNVRVGGPTSDPYECPNTPGHRRYTFRFNRAVDSQQRCATNIQDWVRDELLPWFASRPKTHWSNPRVVTR
jgi:hypothetical protein